MLVKRIEVPGSPKIGQQFQRFFRACLKPVGSSLRLSVVVLISNKSLDMRLVPPLAKFLLN